MYRHLLVPVDGTALSTETVGQAVEFARTLGAHVTFFYASPDHQASLRGEAEVVWSTSPNEFVYAFEGRARELLAKAESAARAFGVPCGSISVVSDKPYDAILTAARNAGCDLIFMASHGRRSTLGMMIGSQTLKVLVHADIPVLVAATGNPAAPARAIGIIRDEHRSLAAVLHAWAHLLASAKRDGTRPDPALMRAIVRYIQDFPLALHHPKEDEYLFKRLRDRTTTVNADLEELERQHERDHRLVAELAALVEREAHDGGTLEALESAVARYSTFIW
ncbi:MAG TPA: universal stress protein, partial [Burkholderiaceae bacterium]|nr:universal stress protein [Burkholderiaceae bacterium]